MKKPMFVFMTFVLIAAFGAVARFGCSHKCDHTGCHNHCNFGFGHKAKSGHFCKRHGG